MAKLKETFIKILNFQEEIDQEARKKFINEQPMEKRGLARKFYRENEKQIKKELREQYLQDNPEIKKQYETWKKRMLQIKILLATGGLTVTTLAGTYIVKTIENAKIEQIKIENSLNNYEVEEIIDQKEEKYNQFFAEAREMKDTNQRNKLIIQQTKQTIVEFYNNTHPETPITSDDLEFFILNENILQKKDKLGNYTYERVAQNVQYEATESQQLVKIGNIYDFRIHGQTVAVFNGNGEPLLDKSINNIEPIFEKTITFVKQSQKLQDIYQYPSNDTQKKQEEKQYKTMAGQLLEESQNIKTEEKEMQGEEK